MPIYEYLCPHCKTLTEEFTHNMNKLKTICPKCFNTAYRTISRSNFNAVELKIDREGNLVE